mgnify:CR=1 FL=1
MARIIMMMLAIAFLASCTKIDPARKDLKSPCAAGTGIDFTGKAPCVKRFPSENIPMVA